MFAAAAKVLLYAPSHRQDVTPVVEHWLEREVPMYGCTPSFFYLVYDFRIHLYGIWNSCYVTKYTLGIIQR